MTNSKNDDREYRLKIAQQNYDRAELEKAAKRCARTGNHKDLQKYLKARRNYL